ncbi:MAG: phage tail protein I [Solibacillus sp.]
MTDLKQIKLAQLLPENLLRDEEVRHLIAAVEQPMADVSRWADLLNYTHNLYELPEAIIDHLLWENHIDAEDGLMLADTLEKKIGLLESAIELHSLKGTPAAIELVCELLNVKARLTEWFEYGGAPYYFRIDVMEVTDRGLTREVMQLLEQLVQHYKNGRSHLEAINIFLTSQSNMYVGAASFLGEEIIIYPYSITNVEMKSAHFIGTGQGVFDSTTIYPRGGA